MSAERFNGRTGRALTEIAASGRAEIDGTSHPAFTAGPLIPPGTEIVVTGWRAEGTLGYVLSVRERSVVEAEATAHPVAPHLDERREVPTEIDWGWSLLTCGQVLTVLICLYAMIDVSSSVSLILEVGERDKVSAGKTRLAVLKALGTATAVFLLSAALFVAFSRVKQLPPAKPPA